MKCTDKEWQHCRVEKMGCPGCYYDDIEVGEYIRTDEGYILKETSEKFIRILLEGKSSFGKLKKHSKNIINLIEVGDIVNGYRVLEIADSIYERSKRILIYRNEKEKYERWMYIQQYDGKVHTQDDIRTILTKEQYTKNCFEVVQE